MNYECRKEFANNRLRIKGRFIGKVTQGELLRQFIGTEVTPEAVSASKNLESGSLQKMIDNYQKELKMIF